MIGSGIDLLPALGAAATVVADDGASAIERWRDLGPMLWLVAAVAAAIWAALLGVLAFFTRCRRVEAGPSTLELGGPETPAVVSLITGDWRLGHEAVPATLLDLAARGLVAIDQVGDRTLVRLRGDSERTREKAAGLEPYERLVLEHVTAHATDGVVPAEALTTGPEDEAKGWWRSFRRAVERDARRRGLARRRWSPGARIAMTVAAFAVGALVGLAATTLPDNPDSEDDDPAGSALAFGLITVGGLLMAVEALNGQRETAAGRDAASRWLGMRTLLAEDPLFAEYPPAGVAIWDRLLAYGAAMGVAHGAVQALPVGAERDDEAWSPVGGHWRVVRIRYPRFVPPGYGRHPARATFVGLFQLGVAVLAFPAATAAADALREAAADYSANETMPAGVDTGVSVALGLVVAAAVVLALRGASMAFAGLADVFQRRSVEGRVLRVRQRGGEEGARWYVAVDDGSAGSIRAWQTLPAGATNGSTVRADVTRWLAHVRNLEVVSSAPVRPSLPDDDEDENALGTLLGTTRRRQGEAWAPLPTVSGRPPPLPDAATVSVAAGRAFELDPAASTHPLAEGGLATVFAGADGATIQVAWVDPALLQAHRTLPRLLRRELPGVGDEAYRAVIGGAVVARRGGHVLLVMGRLPGSSDGDRNRVLEAVARAAVGRPGEG